MKLPRIQYITQDDDELSHLEQTRRACVLGVEWIQLRMKNHTKNEVLETAKECNKICKKANVLFIVNDYLDIATSIDADGVHLGLEDTSTLLARQVLGNKKIIGGTANTLEDILMHDKNKVSYIGLGPFRSTVTKKNLSPVLNTKSFELIKKYNNIVPNSAPVYLVGGIKDLDLKDIGESNADGIAVSSLILNYLKENKSINELKKQLC